MLRMERQWPNLAAKRTWLKLGMGGKGETIHMSIWILCLPNTSFIRVTENVFVEANQWYRPTEGSIVTDSHLMSS